MKIKITIHDCKTNKAYDIQIDNQQKIRTTLEVMRENMEDSFADIDEVQIKSSGRRIPVSTTYEKARIYTGAILLLGEEANNDERG